MITKDEYKHIAAWADVIFEVKEYDINHLKEEIRSLNCIQNKDVLTKHKIRALQDVKEREEEQMLELLSDITYECFYCSKDNYNYNIYNNYDYIYYIDAFLHHLKKEILNILPSIHEKHLTVKFVKFFQQQVSSSGKNTVKAISSRILSVNFKDYCILMQGLQLNDENELICE